LLTSFTYVREGWIFTTLVATVGIQLTVATRLFFDG
jgi:hypothetical protein